MTNADQMRNMNDHELARSNIYFVSEMAVKEGHHYTGLDGRYYKTSDEVYEANRKWLQKEVEKSCE